jgi:hypothetical protein
MYMSNRAWAQFSYSIFLSYSTFVSGMFVTSSVVADELRRLAANVLGPPNSPLPNPTSGSCRPGCAMCPQNIIANDLMSSFEW